MEIFKCYECSFETHKKSVLISHLFDSHAWKSDQNGEELDLSIGPRFCRKCHYQAEDGYVLDAHFWSEHDDDGSEFLRCKICDESFPSLNDLMIHKKINAHRKREFLQIFCNKFLYIWR